METKKYQKYPSVLSSKDTWEDSARDIVTGKVVIPTEEVPELLGWLQDMNWPGAILISEYLAKRPDILIKSITEILEGKDYIWSYWILVSLVNKWDKSVIEPLRESMESLLKNSDYVLEDSDHELQRIYNKNFK